MRNFLRVRLFYQEFKDCDGKYDVVLVQFLYPILFLIQPLLNKLGNRLILALWGSDFYQQKHLNKFDSFIDGCHKIIIGSPNMVTDFLKKHSGFEDKVALCYFGSSPIEELHKLRERGCSRSEACQNLGFSPDKIYISIGHNGSENHQHLKIINSLKNLSKELCNRIELVFPLTYGLNKAYLEKLIEESSSLKIKCHFMTDFLSEKKVAYLRIMSDIMINVQRTDAFSGSMREVLFCGGIVINGAWLPYQFLKDNGLYFEEVNDIEDIPTTLEYIIGNMSTLKQKCTSNSDRIYEISSWSRTIYNWIKVIQNDC